MKLREFISLIFFFFYVYYYLTVFVTIQNKLLNHSPHSLGIFQYKLHDTCFVTMSHAITRVSRVQNGYVFCFLRANILEF